MASEQLQSALLWDFAVHAGMPTLDDLRAFSLI
jgi:hypothetical protein